MIKVLIWNEFAHEQDPTQTEVIKNYPNGIHKYLQSVLEDEFEVRTATLYDEHCGITQELLDDTDVMLWWGHFRHNDVPDDVVAMVKDSVLRGMGIIFLHSAHHSKPFKALMGTSCNLHWRESGDKERLWAVDLSHPIVQGVDAHFTLEHEEMYGEPFGVPEPDKLVMLGWYSGGEVFRSGCCWRKENGKIFYFQPGHESFPTYHNKNIQKILHNAVNWVYNPFRLEKLECPKVDFPND